MPDATDNCPAWPNPSQSLPPWLIPANDSDCDGWSNPSEGTIGTDPTDPCPDDAFDDAYPADFDMNKVVNVFDILTMAPVLGKYSAQPDWEASGGPRKDLDLNGAVNVFDILTLAPHLGYFCG